MKGQQIDYKVVNEFIDAWIVADIQDVKDDQFQIEYSYWKLNNDDDERVFVDEKKWINSKTDILSKLYSHTIEYLTLAQPPNLEWSLPSPILYTETLTEREYIIISGNACQDDLDQDLGIYKYDILNNTFSTITEYPDKFKPNHFIHWIQPNTDNLFIFENKHFQDIGIYNLKENIWDISKAQKDRNINYYGSSPDNPYDVTYLEPMECSIITVPSEPNKLHIFGWDEALEETSHVIFDIDNNTFQRVRVFYGICRSYCYYIESQKKFIYIAHCTDPEGHGQDEKKEKEIGIYFRNITGDTVEWNLIANLPDNVHEFMSILAYDQILVLFEYKTFQIWCFDLIHLEWFQSHKWLMHDLRPDDIVKTSDNFIHAIQIGSKDAQGFDSKQIRFRLMDIIPQGLIELHRNKYFNLIAGYFRTQTLKYNIYFSDDLICLLLQYYPIFF